MTTQRATPRTQEFTKMASRHFMGPFGSVGDTIDRVLERGEGCYVWDTDGKRYMDLCSVTQSLNLGYGQKKIHEAIAKQLARVEFVFPVPPYGNDTVIQFAEEIAKVYPKNMNHSFFTTCGTESVEIAINLAKFYWHTMGKSTKYKVICLTRAYHGSSLLAASLCGSSAMRIPYGPEAPGIVRIPNYHCYRCPFHLTYPQCGVECARFLEHVIEEEGEDSIAAFIAEPVAGSGGAYEAVPEYFPMVTEICKRRNVLFCCDEVLSGFCRTGKMFAIENWAKGTIEPDFLTMAKGISGAYIPMGGVGIHDRVWEVIKGTPFWHGHSYSGHPIGCAASRAALDIYLKEKVAENAAEVGNYAKERLKKEFLPLPNVGDVSGLGLLLSMSIVADKETKALFPPEVNIMTRLRDAHWEAGLMGRFYAQRQRLYFAPPCIITKKEVDEVLDLMYPIVAGLKDIKSR